ncbi:hypothetical protein AB0B28_05980 [Glycomyces sp. NPDC046736]|uniref:hypothetical protein n=1 Tax=Glycomyces sp. NPDC046736 TaxID=3155615 RepID=UPI0033FCAC90
MINDEHTARQVCEGILDSLVGLPFGLGVASVRLDTDSEPGLAFEPTSVEITLAIDRESAVVRWNLALPQLDAVVDLANQVQDALAESRAGWGAQIPRCSVHGHPLEPRVVDGVAVWACPLGYADAMIPIR